MPSIELALLGDFWRRGRWVFLTTFLGLTALPLLVYGALSMEGAFEPASQALALDDVQLKAVVTMHVVFTLMFGFCGITAVFVAQGSLPRFFPRPISTARLVAFQLSAGMAAIAILYLAGATFLNFAVGTNWPLWGPALFLAAALASTQAVVWWAGTSVGAQFLACLVAAPLLVVWFARCYGATVFGDWRVMWTSPSVDEVLTLAALTAGAYAVAIVGVARTRRGDAWDFESLKAWFSRLFSTPTVRGEKFRSPEAAQFWCEWRQKFAVAPAVFVGLFVLVFSGLQLTGLVDSSDAVETWFGLSLGMAFVLPLVFGIVQGNCNTSNKMAGMSHLLATRPLSDAALAKVMLRTAALSLAVAWAVGLVGLAVGVAISFKLGGASAVSAGFQTRNLEYWQLPIFMLLALAACWAILGVTMSVVATGRGKIIVTAFGVLWVGAVLFALTVKAVALEYRPRVDEAGAAISGLAFIGLTIWLIARTRRRQIVPERTTWLVVFAWLVLAALNAVACIASGILQPGWLIHLTGLASLVVLPLVALPAAVSWNRHR